MNPILTSLAGGIAGGVGKAIGSIAGKIVEHIPSPEQARRNKFDVLRKEQDELKVKKIKTARDIYRLNRISGELGGLLKKSLNK